MVHIYNRTGTTGLPLNRKRYIEIATKVLGDSKQNASDITLIFVSECEIQQLNHEFLESNKVTDVLSFPADGEIDPESGREYLGDIVICYQRALEQSDRAGHSVGNEIELLFIHGLLHLMGYDHADDEEKQEMWALQQHYLDHFKIELNQQPGTDDETAA